MQYLQKYAPLILFTFLLWTGCENQYPEGTVIIHDHIRDEFTWVIPYEDIKTEFGRRVAVATGQIEVVIGSVSLGRKAIYAFNYGGKATYFLETIVQRGRLVRWYLDFNGEEDRMTFLKFSGNMESCKEAPCNTCSIRAGGGGCDCYGSGPNGADGFCNHVIYRGVD